MILEEVLSHLFFVRNYFNGVKNSRFLRNSSWVLQGFFRDSLGILHGFFMDSSWILQVFFRDSSGILQKFRNSGILQLHCFLILHIERSICCFAEFADIVTRLGKVSRICSKIVPLFQRTYFDTQLNHLAGTSATEKILENAAVLLQ